MPEWQFYFNVCLYGYRDLYTTFRVAGLCFKGLLSAALKEGKVSPKRVKFFLRELDQAGRHHLVQPVTSSQRLGCNAPVTEEVEKLAQRLETQLVCE